MESMLPAAPWLKHYSSFVPHIMPLPSKSMIDIFEDSVAARADAPAVHYFEQTITYGELDQFARQFAAALAKLDIGKGDVVALYMQNNPQFLIAQYGAWKRGAVVLPLNPMLKRKELEYHLNDSSAKVLVALESLYRDQAQAAVPNTGVQYVFTTSELDFLPEGKNTSPVLEHSERLDFEETRDLIQTLSAIAVDEAENERHRAAVTPADIAYLVYTSGTTGLPKGAMNSHANIAFNAQVYRTWMKLTRSDKVLGLAPLFHITGIVGHTAVAAATGIPLVLMHRFHSQEVLRWMRRWHPTMTVAAITAYIALLNEETKQPSDFASMSKCYSGGAPIAPELTRQFEDCFGVYIHNIYGLTETNSPIMAVPLHTKAPVDSGSGALSVGIPIPNCEVKVVDLEDPSQLVQPGQAGELAVRGPMVFTGYHNRPEATAAAFSDGFFLTGDVVIMDEEGYVYVVDRKKDMINASGFKVWPREVEDVLYLHPAVREAAVVGVPDAYRGETVKAFVALKPDFVDRVAEGDIIEFCKGQLAAYKYPRAVEFLPEIPKTATGKFLRRELRKS